MGEEGSYSGTNSMCAWRGVCLLPSQTFQVRERRLHGNTWSHGQWIRVGRRVVEPFL